MSRPSKRISPRDDAAVLAQILHDGERDGGLAAAGFADDALRLARHELQVEVDDGGDFAGAREVGDAEVAALEHRHVAGLARALFAAVLISRQLPVGSRSVPRGGVGGIAPALLPSSERLRQSLMLISRRPSAIRLKPRMRLETDSAGMSSM